VEPDPVIFMGVLNVCGIVAALEGGQACSWTDHSNWFYVWRSCQ
jgi:hypothetical protein